MPILVELGRRQQASDLRPRQQPRSSGSGRRRHGDLGSVGICGVYLDVHG